MGGQANGFERAGLLLRCAAAGAVAAVPLHLLGSHWSFRKRACLCLLASYLPSYLDGSEYRASPRRSVRLQRFVQRIVRRIVHTFFDVRVCIEDKDSLAALKQCIISIHPHGVLSFDHMLTFCGFSEELDALLPLTSRSALGANILFKIPFLREVNLMGGGVDAGRPTASKCLKAGLSLSVVPGGEREQLLAQAGRIEKLVLKQRLGFVKLALQHGVPIVPVYCFGESQMYYQSRLFIGFRSWVQKTLGIALVMPYGRWGLPGVPLPVPLVYQVGKPVDMPELPEPTKEQIAEHHARYVARLQDMFETHKVKAGYGDNSLELL